MTTYSQHPVKLEKQIKKKLSKPKFHLFICTFFAEDIGCWRIDAYVENITYLIYTTQ